MKLNVFAMQKTDFLSVLALFCRVMLELQCTKSLVRASKNTNALFSATKQKKRKQGHRC